MEDSLEGKRLFIAGGGSGMGRAIATLAAGAGADIVIFGRRPEVLKKTCKDISIRGGGKIAWHAGDATREQDVCDAVDLCSSLYGGVDFAVNSVGANVKDRSLAQLTPASWDALIAGNLDTAFTITQAVLPTFRRQSDGLLIHISSAAAKRADASGAGYQASKAAVAALAQATMFEEKANGVRVSVVFPGFTDTPFVETRPVPPTKEDLAKALKPEEIALMCVAIMLLPSHSYVPELSIYPSRL